MSDHAQPAGGQIPQTGDQTGTLETAGTPQQQEAAVTNYPLTQAGQDPGGVPTNLPAQDPLQPDTSPATGHDREGRAVAPHDPRAGQRVAEAPDTGSEPEQPGPAPDAPPGEAPPQGLWPSGGDEVPDDSDGGEQPRSEPSPPAKPPLPKSARDIPGRLVTGKELAPGADRALNKHRA